MTVESFEIARGFSSEDFKRLNLNAFPHGDWQTAADAFLRRFNGRFFDPLAELAGGSNKDGAVNGFVVLSCAFLLVETLGGFRQGATTHDGKSKDFFYEGLSGIEVEDVNGTSAVITAEQKRLLYASGRCALLHTAGTEKIRVKTSGPKLKAVPNGGFEVNRDAFLNWIRERFEEYASKLLLPENDTMRQNFKMKMGHIANS